MNIRTIEESDMNHYISLYKECFADPPWNDHMICQPYDRRLGVQELFDLAGSCRDCEVTKHWPKDNENY